MQVVQLALDRDISLVQIVTAPLELILEEHFAVRQTPSELNVLEVLHLLQ